VPSFSYLDFEATWRPVRLLTLRAGINNFLDKDPPLINTTAVPPGQANTIDVYDQFGRQVFVAFSLQL
jgi:iron complex outermembrane receptor protein